MSGSGGFYKYRCTYFFTHECPNWVYVVNGVCAECSARGREYPPEASPASQSSPSSKDYTSENSRMPRPRSTEIQQLVLRRVNQSHSNAPEWHIVGKVNGASVEVLADSGSNINSISKNEAERIGAIVEPDTAEQAIRLPSGETCVSLGAATIGFTFEGEDKSYILHCAVVGTLEWAMIVGYDFLKTTETLTRYCQQRIKEVTPSNSYRMPMSLMIESNTVSEGTGARMEGFINGIRTTVVPDTGSAILAMSTFYADRQGLEIDSTRRKRVTFVDGSTAMTRGVVKGTWVFLNPNKDNEPSPQHTDHCCPVMEGLEEAAESRSIQEEADEIEQDKHRDPWDYVWEYEWHVIDSLPVDAVLNLDFIKRHDVFNKHQHSFIRTSSQSKVPEILGICFLPGGCKGLVNLAEAFLADLASPDPFSFDMVIRESVRRSEIQRTILNLPHNLQSSQRDNEERRIINWDNIRNLKDRGEVWKLRRDQYIASLRPQQTPISSSQSPTGRRDASNNHEKGKRSRFWRPCPRKRTR
ncbi:hypothetical protein F5Y08DRAFT_320178 [Xylaria arbuscula]|nr:hypothetical protein F5Y08DRAFT_320178 [Xylaria arbuscula]